MADQPKKKVKIVAKKKGGARPAEPQAAGASAASAKDGSDKQRAAGSTKKKDRGLLDIQRLFDFPAGVAENARDVWMAGIGALSSVEEAGQALYDELVRKGEKWERESRQKLVGARKTAGTAAERARDAAGELGRQPGRIAGEVEAQIQRVVEESVEGVLHRLGVPTHEEVKELVQRVELLSGKVDQLMTQLREGERPAPVSKTASTAPMGKPVLYRIASDDDGWVVQKEGAARATSRHKTKVEAVDAGRETASKHAPSTLVIFKKDGTEQTRVSYEG